ncbi:tetratricopeptide repeat protein [uncultured Porphyromonas sp.]|uniref:tetratricopeptide repeat protein n=1 Tax=uncultured Porphyromonas sp. TaxID=159274 RepID=UPI002631E274|nr:tetratricopeptide repeat protein [uncultured Porphyromonas sp.]
MRTVFLSFLLLISSISLSASESVDSLFSKGDYRGAAAAMESLIESEGATSSRYANLGNCYYQLGDLGHAMLSYERAHLLDPRDEQINAQRTFLMKKTIDKLPDAESWFSATGGAIAYALPLPVLLVLSLLFFVGFVGSVVAFALSRSRDGKRITFYSGLVSLVLSIFTGALILHWVYAEHQAKTKAVIIQPEVNVYRSPSQKSEVANQLHEGTRIRLVGQPVGAYQQFTLSDGRGGWLLLSAIEPLVKN